jgi:hypothetical protein
LLEGVVSPTVVNSLSIIFTVSEFLLFLIIAFAVETLEAVKITDSKDSSSVSAFSVSVKDPVELPEAIVIVPAFNS